MKKKSLIVFMILILALNTFGFTAEINNRELEDSNVRHVGFSVFHRIKTSYASGVRYGGWREGPSGRGPANLSINSSYGVNFSFTSSISGSYPIGISSISAHLGFGVNVNIVYGASYSIYIPSGHMRTIWFRPKYKVHTVVQELVQRDNRTHKETVLRTSYGYVKEFVGWDYSWE